MTYYTGLKPFKCSKCDKSFLIASHLKEHDMTHIGEKPFNCTKWDKSFSTSSYLDINEDTHERSHSSAQSVTSNFQDQGPWSTQERSLSNAPSVTRASWNQTTKWNMRGPIQERSHSSAWRPHKQATWRKMSEPHTGEKPFKCLKCDKGISKSDH